MRPESQPHASTAGAMRTATARHARRDSVTLGGAIVTTGLLAGVYYAFAVAIMPALRDADDTTLVTTMQQVNEAIVNPAFMTVFLGGPALTAAAAWQLRQRTDGPGRRGARLALVALALHLADLGLTAGANIPLNDALAEAGDPATMTQAQLAEARAAYEQPWTRRHLLRTGVTVAAFGCLAAAGLVSRRRPSTSAAGSPDAFVDSEAGMGASAPPTPAARLRGAPSLSRARGGAAR